MSNDDVFVEGGSMITQYGPDEARAAGEQARESGVWLNCHAQAPESIKLAVRNGFRSVYHCTYADAEATQYGGQVMDLPVGLLRAGYLADVLVVRGEPAEDVSVLQDTENLLAIMQNGAFWKLADQLTAA
jgi:imidazolonepropionase-like amidohydrolase